MANQKEKRSEKMISEQDKQAILNGAYGITRDGHKCKYIGSTDNCYYSNLFVIYNTSELIINSVKLTDNFTYYANNTHINDVVELWKDLPEPFNLEKALAGEPVMLRCGLKAYVKFTAPPEYTGDYPLQGYSIVPDSSEGIIFESWTLAGTEFTNGVGHDNDIIGMWKEPEPVSKNVTVTLPRALREPKDDMWYITESGVFKSSYKKDISLTIFNNRSYFASEADAEAWLKAMQDSRR